MTLCLYRPGEGIANSHELTLSKPGYVSIDSKTSGTGGFEKLEHQTPFEPRTHAPILYGGRSCSPMPSAIAPRDQLQFIRETLKLNMSDLASVLEVSRPTVYSWLEGVEPSRENYSQIARLKDIADEVNHLTIPRFEKLLKRPLFDGSSFLDKLKATEDPVVFLPLLKQLADREQATRSTPKGFGKTISNEGFLEQSTPIYESD